MKVLRRLALAFLLPLALASSAFGLEVLVCDEGGEVVLGFSPSSLLPLRDLAGLWGLGVSLSPDGRRAFVPPPLEVEVDLKALQVRVGSSFAEGRASSRGGRIYLPARSLASKLSPVRVGEELFLTVRPCRGGGSAWEGRRSMNLFLVNKAFGLPRSFVPPDLASVEGRLRTNKPGMRLCREALLALVDLFEAARAAGFDLVLVSAHRTWELQSYLFEKEVELNSRRGHPPSRARELASSLVAPPGRSEHQLGLAVDVLSRGFLSRGLVGDFGRTLEGRWLRENAHRFGFVVRYPKDREQITGFQHEPWHLRYVGEVHASAMREMGLCLEEYLELVERRGELELRGPMGRRYRLLFLKGFGEASRVVLASDRFRLVEFYPDNRGNLLLLLELI